MIVLQLSALPSSRAGKSVGNPVSTSMTGSSCFGKAVVWHSVLARTEQVDFRVFRVAGRSDVPTLGEMKLNLRKSWLLATLTGMCVLSGCSGIDASHSVSPASFFVPGLLKVQPPMPVPTDPVAPNRPEFAQVSPE